MDTPTEHDYFLEIEAAFAQLRGTPFVFSSKDWALMKSWHDEGIPLAIVLEAMDSCFRKSGEGKRKRMVSSLTYCRHAVVELWSERKDLQIGAQGTVPEADPGAGVERLAADLRQVAAAPDLDEPTRATIETAAQEVSECARGASVPVIEERLVEIEERLYASLWSTMSADARADVETQIASILSSGEEGERVRRAHRRRILRGRYRIPTLSLFA